jgi:ribosome-associated protein
MNTEGSEKIILPNSDRELLDLCKVDTFRASGKGGQHVNKTDSAVRLTYLPIRLVVSSQKERSQYLNKQNCLKKLREKVEKLNYRPPKRVSTKAPRSEKIKIRESKSHRGQKKQMRFKVNDSHD